MLHYQHTFTTFTLDPISCLHKHSAEASELFTHGLFSSSTKRCPRSTSFRGPKRWKSEGGKSGP